MMMPPLTENGTEYPVRIWLDEFNRQNFEDVKQLSIINPMWITC
jgi:HAE1 family hydrophobic/amphiphilic exporter-1